MPSGTLQWFDPGDNTGSIEHLGHHYPVAGTDMEPRARVTGARVRFDVLRDSNVKRAVNVRRVEGTRTAHTHGRMGDLVGSRHPSDKTRKALTRRAGDVDRVQADRPAELVRRWLVALARHDAGAALPFYADDAVIHADMRTFNGRNKVREFLYSRLVGGGAPQPRLHGADGDIVVDWPAASGHAARTARLRIAHDRIVEQWGPDLPAA
jgi:hypothetical protein